MNGNTLRDLLSEQDLIVRRQRAIKSLLAMRVRRLRESLDQRIKRAHRDGMWEGLTRAQCKALHDEEKALVRRQLAELEREGRRSRGELYKVKLAKLRAERARASQSLRRRTRK
ncbi:MAG: hypothetical protein ACREI3_03975 [Nitrospirales bacterium]